jgi:hypothetical protein
MVQKDYGGLSVRAPLPCAHWDQFAALFGAGDQRPDFGVRWKRPMPPPAYLAGLIGAITRLSECGGVVALRSRRTDPKFQFGSNSARKMRETKTGRKGLLEPMKLLA